MAIDGADDPAAKPDEEAAAGPAEPIFRVIRRGGNRKAFRLERAFWSALDVMAKALGQRAGTLVMDHLEARDSRNASAEIRVMLLEHFVERARSLEATFAPERIIAAIQSTPSPCFAIGANKQLYSCNNEFLDFVRTQAAGAAPESLSSVRLALDAPVDRLVAVLESSPARVATCGYSILLAGRSITGRCRVTLLPTERNRILIGYLLS